MPGLMLSGIMYSDRAMKHKCFESTDKMQVDFSTDDSNHRLSWGNPRSDLLNLWGVLVATGIKMLTM